MRSTVKMVIMSHLSDVQIEMYIDKEKADLRLNFVKMLLMKYPDTTQLVSEETLNNLWVEVTERLKKRL